MKYQLVLVLKNLTNILIMYKQEKLTEEHFRNHDLKNHGRRRLFIKRSFVTGIRQYIVNCVTNNTNNR